MAQLSLGALGGVQLAPDVLEEQRGAWCSPVEYTEAAGSFDVDAFTNPRSTLIAAHTCMLERGDDGFGLDRRDVPGTFYVNPNPPDTFDRPRLPGYHVATAETTVWIQPPYDIVIEALAHYGHTRFTALLRLDTSTVWFQLLFAGITTADLENPELRAKLEKCLKGTSMLKVRPPLCEVIMVPKNDRLEFVPPPGVKASSNPFPHGLFYKRAADVPDAIKAKCYPWPTPNHHGWCL